MNMSRLNGKVAIITGAASGMGRAALQLFAAEGARVAATDVSEEALRQAVEEVTADGGEALALRHDVSSAEDWQRAVDTVLAEWGTIDILVNNAGIAMPKGVLDAELDDWNTVMSINVTGTWLGIKSVLPTMQAAGRGSIVNVSSIGGIVGGVSDGGGAAYSASKGAVRSLTKHVAQWFAKDNIRVNSVHPGPIDTGMTRGYGLTKESMANPDTVPLPPHAGDADDIAYGLLYLASDEAKFVTGEELIIDGGFTTH
jgi:NAD(P)-dependent dehydrogenase (short-subunit alcohol dehydrogenase family)